MTEVRGSSGTTTLSPEALTAQALAFQETVFQQIGLGTMGRNGPTPNAPSPEMISDIRTSLAALGLNMTQAQVDVLIVEVTISLRDIESQTQSNKIKNDQTLVQGQLATQAKQIDEMTAKIKEAKEAQESASIADKIKLAFEWIGAIVAIVVAVVAIATSPLTGGALAIVGALLIAAAVAALISAADSTVTVATGHGIGYHSAKSMGKSDEEALKHEQAFTVAIAVIGAVCGIAAGGTGAVSAFRSGCSAAAKAGVEGAKVATREIIKAGLEAVFKQGFKEGTSQTLKWVSRGVEMTEAVNTIGTAATTATSTAYKGVAQMASADAKRAEAESKENEAVISMLNDVIDQAFTRLLAAGDRFNTILDGIMEARNDRAQFTARAQFAG